MNQLPTLNWLSSGEAVTLSMGLILSVALVTESDKRGLKIIGGLGLLIMGGQLLLNRMV